MAVALGRAAKAVLPSEHDLRDFLHALDETWTDDVKQELRGLLDRLATERADAALTHVINDGSDIAHLTQQANQRAASWADERVGNLITEVSDTTRSAVNVLVSDAIEEGLSNQELADRIGEAFDFSDARALMIARTETVNAETQGTLAGYAASGVVGQKQWSSDGEACDICEEMDGETVDLHDTFSDGSDGPPAHPNCRCSVVPVVGETE
jgi:SPP1 gp7 family putative phage head morphogenesis protein